MSTSSYELIDSIPIPEVNVSAPSSSENATGNGDGNTSEVSAQLPHVPKTEQSPHNTMSVEALFSSNGVSEALAPAVYQFMDTPSPSETPAAASHHGLSAELSDNESQVSELSALPPPSPALRSYDVYDPAQPLPAPPPIVSNLELKIDVTADTDALTKAEEAPKPMTDPTLSVDILGDSGTANQTGVSSCAESEHELSEGMTCCCRFWLPYFLK